jgi:hypothetical protein
MMTLLKPLRFVQMNLSTTKKQVHALYREQAASFEKKLRFYSRSG